MTTISGNYTPHVKERLEALVNTMTEAIAEFANSDLFASVPPLLYHTKQDTKPDKQFVVRQPEETKAWRQKMKGYLREYLQLKFSASDLEAVDHPSEDPIDISVTRFKVSTHGSWYELPYKTSFEEKIGCIEGGQKRFTTLSLDEGLIFQKGVLLRVLNGASFEEIHMYNVGGKHPDFYWSGWKTGLGEYSPEISKCLPECMLRVVWSLAERILPANFAWKEYQNVIHPSMTEAAFAMLPTNPEGRPRVVEICGGEGELAVSVARKYGKPLDYHLLEFNDRSRDNAKNLFTQAEGIQGNFVAVKTDVTNENDYFLDAEKQVPMLSNSIDLILGSGAIACFIYRTQEDAKKIARKCFELLKPGGKMILSGYTYSYLSSTNYTKIGFKVHNTALPGQNLVSYSLDPENRFLSKRFNNQFFVLEKPLFT